MPGPGENPLVDFIADKYYGGQNHDTLKEKLYTDQDKFDQGVQELYSHAKDNGSYSGVTYGEFRNKFVSKYGQPPVKKKEDTQQSQNPSTNGGLSGNVSQPGQPSAQPNSAEAIFAQYKNASIPSTFAPTLGNTQEEDLDAHLTAQEMSDANSVPETTNPFQPVNQTDNPNILNNPTTAIQRKENGVTNGIPAIGKTTNQLIAESNQKQADDAKVEEDTKDLSPYGATMYYLNDFAGRFNKQLLETPASVLDFVARSAYKLDRVTGTNPDKSYEDYVTGQWADSYRDTLSKYFGDIAFENTESGGRAELDNHIQSQIAPALADLITIFAGGSGVAKTGTKALTQTALRDPNVAIAAFKELGAYATSPGTTLSSMQVFNSEYEQAYQTLREHGADDETARSEAWNSGMRNAIISAPLEALPTAKFFDRLDDLSGGSYKSRVASMMVSGVKGFTEEASTEVAQQFFSNVDASLSYDSTREWTDGLIEAGLIGGLLGGTLNAITGGLTYSRDKATTPEAKAEYQKSIDYVTAQAQKVEDVRVEIQQVSQAGRIKNIDNGVTDILSQKTNITNDEILQLEDLNNQIEDINKPMADDLARKTSGIDARIKDLMLERELLYQTATTGKQIQDASIREKEIGWELTKLFNKKYNARKEILQRDYIKEAQDKIAKLNLPKDATRKREDTTSDQPEYSGANGDIQEEGGNRNVAPTIPGESPEASSSNSDEQSGQVQEEDNVVPAPTQTPEVTLPATKENERIRKTALTVQESDFIADKAKDKTLSNAIYPVKSLDVTEREADTLLKEHIEKGDDAVLNYVLRTPTDLKPDVKVGIAAAGLRYFAEKSKIAQKAGDEVLVERYADTQYEIIEKAITEQATDYGRASNAIKLIKNASPDVQVISTKRAIENKRNDYKEKNKEKFKEISNDLNDVNEKVSRETLQDKKVKDKLNKIKEGNKSKVKPAKKDSYRKEKIQQAKKEAKQELDKLFKELGKRASSGVDPVLAGKIVKQGAKYGYYLAVEGYYDFKEWSAKMRSDLGPDAEDYIDEIWKASHEREKISEVAKQVKENEVRFNTEKAIKDNLDESFDKIVKKHYTEVDKKKSDLTKKLIDDLDLSDADAKELSALVEETFDRLSKEKKLAILKNKENIGDKIYPKKLKQIYEKVIEMSNIGSVDENALANIYADEFSTKKLTPEQTKELRKKAEKVQTAPEGFQKQNAVQDLYKYQDSLKNFSWADVATSIWYANVLSGFKTHITNTFANLVTTLSELTVAIAKNPRNTPYMIKGLLKGYQKGLLEANNTRKTGYSPVKNSKIDTPNALENIDIKNIKGVKDAFLVALSKAKIVSRLMSAADAIAYSGNREMRAYEMAAEMARSEKKSSPDAKIWDKVSEILNQTSEKKSEAEAQAKEEGLSGQNYKRRVYEIMEQKRGKEILEDSSDFALRATFNGPSEGTLGLITDAVAGLVEKFGWKGVKPLKLVVPFTTIISNVANASLDWTPYGYKRAIFGTGALDLTAGQKYSREYTSDEKKKATIKATAGILSMIAAYALSDPEDGLIEITSNGTGDVKKNYDLAKNGWQKYSIRVGDTWISYQNTPFAIPFAIIGNLRDDEKYKGKSLEDKSTGEKLFMSTMNGIQFVTDMTFLKGMTDFTSIFSADNAAEKESEVLKLLTNSVKGYVLPNLYTQVAKEVMSASDTPMKQVDHFWEQLYRDIPIANNGMYNMIDGLGDPIVPDTDKFTSKKKIEDPQTEKVWDLLIANNVFPGKVSKDQLQSGLNDIGWKGEVTPEQYYKYSKVRGTLIKEKILKHMSTLNKMTPEKVKEQVDKYKREATKGAKYQILNIKN